MEPSRFNRFQLQKVHLLDAAKAAGLNSFVDAVRAAGLEPTLTSFTHNQGPFTVFAPNDAAFSQFTPKRSLTDIMRYHIVPGGVVRPTRNGKSFETLLEGKEINVLVRAKNVDEKPESFILSGAKTPAKVTKFDFHAENGVIHVIDQVLIPYEGDEAPKHN